MAGEGQKVEAQADPFPIYPEELTAFVLKFLRKKLLDAGTVTDFVPRLMNVRYEGRPFFSLAPLDYRTMPHTRYSSTIDDYFEFLRLEGLVAHYNPTAVTPAGQQYLEEIFDRFVDENPQQARELAKALGTSLEDLVR